MFVYRVKIKAIEKGHRKGIDGGGGGGGGIISLWADSRIDVLTPILTKCLEKCENLI